MYKTAINVKEENGMMKKIGDYFCTSKNLEMIGIWSLNLWPIGKRKKSIIAGITLHEKTPLDLKEDITITKYQRNTLSKI